MPITERADVEIRIKSGEDEKIQVQIHDLIRKGLEAEGYTDISAPRRSSYSDRELKIDWWYEAKKDGKRVSIPIGQRCKLSTEAGDLSVHGTEPKAWEQNKLQPKYYFSGKTELLPDGTLELIDAQFIEFEKLGFDSNKIGEYRKVMVEMAKRLGPTVCEQATKAGEVFKYMYRCEIHLDREFWLYPQRKNKYSPFKTNIYFIEPYDKYPDCDIFKRHGIKVK
jgi:hypothetical protein